MSEPNYSYGELVELGISVCASCGGANINLNKLPSEKHEDKEDHYCFDCELAEGTALCMPDDKHFYNKAKDSVDKIRGGV